MICDDKDCFNYDNNNLLFCEKCMDIILRTVNEDTLLELYDKAKNDLDFVAKILVDSGAPASEVDESLAEAKNNLFNIFNKVMLKSKK